MEEKEDMTLFLRGIDVKMNVFVKPNVEEHVTVLRRENVCRNTNNKRQEK